MSTMTGSGHDFYDLKGNWLGVVISLTRQGPGGMQFNGIVDPSAVNPKTAGVLGIPQPNWVYYATDSGKTAFGVQVNAGDFVVYDGFSWKAVNFSTSAVIDSMPGVLVNKGLVQGNKTNPTSGGITGTPVNGWLYKVSTAGSSTFGFQVNAGDFVLFDGSNWVKINQSSLNSILSPTQGGTGIASYTQGDMLYANASNTLAKLSGNSTVIKKYLTQIGDGSFAFAPIWNTISLADITGAAPLASPTFTGSPKSPTLTITDNSSAIATTAFVNGFVSKAIQVFSSTPTVITGDVTGSGTNNINLILNTVNANTGTFGNSTQVPVITVNAQGLVTAVNTTSVNAINSWSAITNKPTSLAGYGITDAVTSNANKKNQSVWLDSLYLSGNNLSHWARIFYSGTLTNDRFLYLDIGDANRLLTFNGDLNVVSNTSISGTNTGDQTITLTGDISGSGTGSFVTTLATVNATTGTFGSSSLIPVITVNAQGLVTSINNTNLTTSFLTWSNITSKPTTLAGYGITDAAPLNSPVFTGNPKSPTVTSTDNSSAIATTAFVKSLGYVADASIAKNVIVVTASGNYTAQTSDYIIIVSKTVNETTNITLPIGTENKMYIIKDGKGNASTYNISVTANISDKIMDTVIGSPGGSVQATANGESITLVYKSNVWYRL